MLNEKILLERMDSAVIIFEKLIFFNLKLVYFFICIC